MASAPEASIVSIRTSLPYPLSATTASVGMANNYFRFRSGARIHGTKKQPFRPSQAERLLTGTQQPD